MPLTFEDFIIRAIFTVIFGGIIGFERQWRHKMAGLRTNMLVALGAFLFVTLSMIIEGETSPTRISAQIVSGIGFLGGGVIIRDGLNVRGLNTAATLWCSASVGVLTSAGLVWEAFVGTILVLLANIFLRNFSEKLENLTEKENPESDSEDRALELQTLRLKCTQKAAGSIASFLMQIVDDKSLKLHGLEINKKNNSKGEEQAEILARINPGGIQHLMEKLEAHPEIQELAWASPEASNGVER